MSRHLYTLEEYFALERASNVRYEYWAGEIIAMSGASPNHNRIAADVARALGNQLEGRCEVFREAEKIKPPRHQGEHQEHQGVFFLVSLVFALVSWWLEGQPGLRPSRTARPRWDHIYFQFP